MIEEDFYSNLAVIPFSLAGFTWHSAEYSSSKLQNLPMMKLSRKSNPVTVLSAVQQLDKTGRFIIRDDWENIKVSVMEQAIRARFEQHHELAIALKHTRRKLYDHSAADSFWGIGVDGHGIKILVGEI